jgi:hypothetical protein
MAAVLEGRGEGDDINMIAEALHRCGYISPLMGTSRFQGVCKELARGVVNAQSEHWTPRHAVHVWDRLELSTRKMDALSHLLSDTSITQRATSTSLSSRGKIHSTSRMWCVCPR